MRTPISYYGGKQTMLKHILPLIPSHKIYTEAFCGGAAVLFAKRPSEAEIINDINRELTNLYRCLKHHLGELVAQFRWMLVSRDDFDAFLQMPPDSLTDIQRAARFFYLAKTSFGARINKPTFGIAATGAPRLNLLRIEEELSDAHVRLARVFVENKPYDQVIQRFDKPGTLFYIDPPYWGNEKDYGDGLFSRDDFARLAGLLGALKGKFILSLNDTPGVRETFGGFRIESVQTRYSIGASVNKPVGEVLICNFKGK